MKIINLGILGLRLLGKTTLTESLLYTSGAIAELGKLDEGTTRTDTMNLERQKGNHYPDSSDIFSVGGCKSQHYRYTRPYGFFGGSIPFFIRIRRSSIISFCKGWHTGTDPYTVSCTTDNDSFPEIFFINKIDQEGIDLPMVYREMKAKLSSEIIVKQKVGVASPI